MKPTRLQLSRMKGFDLQVASVAINGLQAIRVSRPGKWGNPFVTGHDGTAVQCVALYRQKIMERLSDLLGGPVLRTELTTIRGKNLACWCKLGTACHADVLLEIANKRGEATG